MLLCLSARAITASLLGLYVHKPSMRRPSRKRRQRKFQSQELWHHSKSGEGDEVPENDQRNAWSAITALTIIYERDLILASKRPKKKNPVWVLFIDALAFCCMRQNHRLLTGAGISAGIGAVHFRR